MGNIDDPDEIVDDISIVLNFLLFFMWGAYIRQCLKLCCSGGCFSEYEEEKIPLGHIYNVR